MHEMIGHCAVLCSVNAGVLLDGRFIVLWNGCSYWISLGPCLDLSANLCCDLDPSSDERSWLFKSRRCCWKGGRFGKRWDVSRFLVVAKGKVCVLSVWRSSLNDSYMFPLFTLSRYFRTSLLWVFMCSASFVFGLQKRSSGTLRSGSIFDFVQSPRWISGRVSNFSVFPSRSVFLRRCFSWSLFFALSQLRFTFCSANSCLS